MSDEIKKYRIKLNEVENYLQRGFMKIKPVGSGNKGYRGGWKWKEVTTDE